MKKRRRFKTSRPAFGEFQTEYDCKKMAGSIAVGAIEYYTDLLKDRTAGTVLSHDEAIRRADLGWYLASRPYYKVWPSIVPALLRTSLDVKGSLVDTDGTLLGDLPYNTVCLRFLAGHELQCPPVSIHAILLSKGREPVGSVLHLSPVYFATVSGMKYLGRWSLPVHLDDLTLEAAISDYLCEGEAMPPGLGIQNLTSEVLAPCLRIAIAVALLAKDPTIIEPEVLACDDAIFQKTHDIKYVEKAKRRGVIGWNIGRECETMPHTRRPHFAIRWMGKGGKKVPRLRSIKGCVVHREFMTKVPTGYITPDGMEVEVDRCPK